MRFIEKTVLPEEISDALEGALTKEWSWNDFGKHNGKAKFELRQFLASEQNGLCAYSELALEEFDFHIEHIKPKNEEGGYKHLRFEYSNLVASSPKNEADLESRIDSFGGHKKGEDYDEVLFISPTEPECSRYFQYTPTGDIRPSTGLTDGECLRAVETIRCLGLQTSKLLINKREKVYSVIQAQLNYMLDQPDALEAILNDYFEPDSNGHLKPFQSLVKQMASR